MKSVKPLAEKIFEIDDIVKIVDEQYSQIEAETKAKFEEVRKFYGTEEALDLLKLVKGFDKDKKEYRDIVTQIRTQETPITKNDFKVYQGMIIDHQKRISTGICEVKVIGKNEYGN